MRHLIRYTYRLVKPYFLDFPRPLCHKKAMQVYFGAKAILARAGFSPNQYRHFPAIKLRHQIPCFPRKHIHRRPMLYASEAMMISWELMKAKQFHEEMKSAIEQNKDRRYRALERERKPRSHAA